MSTLHLVSFAKAQYKPLSAWRGDLVSVDYIISYYLLLITESDLTSG